MACVKEMGVGQVTVRHGSDRLSILMIWMNHSLAPALARALALALAEPREQLLDQRQAKKKKKSMTHVMSLTTWVGCMNVLWPKAARLVAMLLFCCRTCNKSKQAVNTSCRVAVPCLCALLHAPWP